MSEKANVGRVFNLTPSGGGDMPVSVYDPTGKQTDIFAFAENLITALENKVMAASVYDPTGQKTDVYAYAKNAVTVAMNEFFESLLSEGAVYRTLCDSEGVAIQDSDGNDILARLMISIK